MVAPFHPVADAGAVDAVWRLESSWRYAPWVSLLAGVAIVALVVYCYAKELSPAGRSYRVLLGGLRLTTIALLLAMLSELLLAGSRSGRPSFAVIIDRSPSMGVTATKAAGAGEAERAPPAIENRLEKVLSAARGEASRLLDRLSEGYSLSFYAAADRLESLPIAGDDYRGALAPLRVEASATGTRLGDAIDQALAGAGGAPPQGVLIFSDGQVTAGRSLLAAADAARRSAAPLYFVGVGDERPPPDIALTDLLAEEVVFVDDLVSFRATVRANAAASGPIRVTLRRDGDPAVLAEQIVTPADGAPAMVQLLHRHEQPGVYRYTLAAEAAGATTDERNPDNNALRHELTVRDQKVGVLLAAGGPSYEFRYLKHLLERDSTVNLSSFLQEADLEYAPADPSAVSRLPLRAEELEEHDVLLLIDLDPRLVPRSFWPALRRFVGESGGGLGLVAGPRYLPGAYGSLADFAALCPAEIGGGGLGPAGSAGSSGFRVTPTPLGLQRAAMQLSDDRAATGLTWRRLPELYWHAELGALKPAAQTLAAHPTATTAAGAPAPLIVSQYFGAGEVVLHAVDSTYRWRRQVGDVYFARYWVQTIRGLARGRLAAGGSGARLTVERQRYEAGETVRVRLRSESVGGEPTLLLESATGPQREVALAPAADQRGVYEATLPRLPVGRYRALLGGAGEPVVAAFEVTAPPGEFAHLEMAKGPMRAAAERSRGRFFPLDQIDQLADALPPPRRALVESLPPYELWNRWWMLAAVSGCLTAEWILRKRGAML